MLSNLSHEFPFFFDFFKSDLYHPHFIKYTQGDVDMPHAAYLHPQNPYSINKLVEPGSNDYKQKKSR